MKPRVEDPLQGIQRREREQPAVALIAPFREGFHGVLERSKTKSSCLRFLVWYRVRSKSRRMLLPKLCPKVILEGTRLTFKTEIAFELNQHPRVVGPRKYRYHSPLISAEWCAFTNVPWGRGMINFAPEEEDLAMETYRTWVRLFELQRYYSWIVDRFHISTRMYQLRNHGKDHDFTWLEDRIAPLGFRLVYCTRSAESFQAAREERLKVSGNPSQYDDLQAFVEEQQLLDRLIGESALPVLKLDISDNDVNKAVETIADWLEETGGLYM
jgi:hypothetical protein